MWSFTIWSVTGCEAVLQPANARRAVFFDRDGVLNPLFTYPTWGADSPARAAHLSLYADAAPAISEIRSAGFLALLASNQPGIAKGKYSPRTFATIDHRLTGLLQKGGASLDGRFYCLHHPAATVLEYKADCDCRKPKPGLLRAAADEFGLQLDGSYFIGDSECDVLAAQAAGCQPFLLQRKTGPLADWARRFPGVRIVTSLSEAANYICEGGVTNVA